MLRDSTNRDRTLAEALAGEAPEPPRSPIERPPANGPYNGPARVRVLPPGVCYSEADGDLLFGSGQRKAAARGRAKQSARAKRAARARWKR